MVDELPNRAGSRGIPGLVALAVVFGLWAYAVLSPQFDQVFGWHELGRFLDLRGSVAAGEVDRAGGDAYASNPNDPSGRPHLYSSWWLVVGKLGLTQRDVDWLGEALGFLVLLVAFGIWWPANWREAGVAVAGLGSPAWLLAIYRGNNDLVIFILLALAIHGAQRSRAWARIAAAGGIGALAVLKYFPGMAIIAVLHGRTRREVLAGLALFTGVLVLGYPSLQPTFAVIAKSAPQTGGLHSFGMTILIDALSLRGPVWLAWLIGIAVAGLGFQLGRLANTPMTAEREARTLAAVVSGAVIVGCFVIGTSFTYKFVFLWWTLPWLRRDAPTLIGRGRAVFLVVLLLVLFWADGVVAMVVNGLGPSWTPAARARAIPLIHAAVVLTQLGYWLVMAAFLRLAIDWSRRQTARLSAKDVEAPAII